MSDNKNSKTITRLIILNVVTVGLALLLVIIMLFFPNKGDFVAWLKAQIVPLLIIALLLILMMLVYAAYQLLQGKREAGKKFLQEAHKELEREWVNYFQEDRRGKQVEKRMQAVIDTHMVLVRRNLLWGLWSLWKFRWIYLSRNGELIVFALQPKQPQTIPASGKDGQKAPPSPTPELVTPASEAAGQLGPSTPAEVRAGKPPSVVVSPPQAGAVQYTPRSRVPRAAVRQPTGTGFDDESTILAPRRGEMKEESQNPSMGDEDKAVEATEEPTVSSPTSVKDEADASEDLAHEAPEDDDAKTSLP